MNELVPVALGIWVGFFCALIRERRQRIWMLVTLSMIFGFTATILCGELRLGLQFLFFDVALAAAAAIASMRSFAGASNGNRKLYRFRWI